MHKVQAIVWLPRGLTFACAERNEVHILVCDLKDTVHRIID